MLSEFQRQLFQLPLIATCWPCVRDRYVQEKRNLSFPLRLILSMIEQTIVLFYHNIVQMYAPNRELSRVNFRLIDLSTFF